MNFSASRSLPATIFHKVTGLPPGWRPDDRYRCTVKHRGPLPGWIEVNSVIDSSMCSATVRGADCHMAEQDMFIDHISILESIKAA